MSRRYKAPTDNRAVLADPPTDRLPELVAVNRARLDRADVRIDDWSSGTLNEFRYYCRMAAIFQAWEYLGRRIPNKPVTAELDHMPGVTDNAPLIVAGHQPELVHPGVWAKNFALNALARRVGGVALNLIVDNDTATHTAIRVPFVNGRNPDAVGVKSVAFDTASELSYEEYRVRDPKLFDSFAERVADVLPDSLGEPLLCRAWAEVRRHPDRPVGEAFVAARRAIEKEWGCENLELPVSQLATSEQFLRFAFHLCGNAGRFAEVYNDAILTYRRQHGIRSTSHPFPELSRDGEWQEVPLWAWNGQFPRRGRVWVSRPASDRVSFRFDNGLPPVTVPYPFRGWGPDHFVVMSEAYKFRPRALTLTLFARVCLGDFFIHGIGGGKYDEVTDAIIRDYFGIEPPAFQVLSATLHLPLPTFPTTPADVAALARRERDIIWNPQRHVPGPEGERPEVRELVQRHRELEAADPADRAGRRQRFHDFRAVGEELRPRAEGRLHDVRDWLGRARQEAAANAALMWRDFAWVLYPEDVLRPFLQGFL